MGSGYGLSRMLGGVVQGIDAAKARYRADEDRDFQLLRRQQDQQDRETRLSDLEYERERNKELDARQDKEYEYKLGRREITDKRADTRYEQEQQDREHRIARRTIAEADADENRKIVREADKFKRHFWKQMAVWNSTRDPSIVEELYNDKFPDGYEADIQELRGEDGSVKYRLQIGKDGKKSAPQDLSFDELSSLATSMVEPEYSVKVFREARAKAAEQERKERLEYIKKGYNPDGTSRAFGGAGEGEVTEIEKEARKVAGEMWGGKFENGILKGFDSRVDKAKYTSTYAMLIPFRGMGFNMGAATDMARREMSKIAEEANEAADTAMKEGRLEKKDRDSFVIEKIDLGTDEYLQEFFRKYGGGSKGPSIGRQDDLVYRGDASKTDDLVDRGGSARRQPLSSRRSMKPSWEEYRSRAIEVAAKRGVGKAEAEKAAREEYNKRYGQEEGAADRGPAIPGISDAGASELPEETGATEAKGPEIGRDPKQKKAQPEQVDLKRARESEPVGSARDRFLKNKMKIDAQATRRDFDKVSRKAQALLYTRGKGGFLGEGGATPKQRKIAKEIVSTFTKEYLQQLTPKQRRAAVKLIQQAKKVIGRSDGNLAR